MALLCVVTLLLVVAGLCQAQHDSTYEYLSRPDITPPVLFVDDFNAALSAPGYIFLTPNSPANPNFTQGPAIYNNQGALVWSGYKALRSGYKSFDFQVCPYQGSDHLCFTQFAGNQEGGVGPGSYSQIMDLNYQVVREVAPSGQYEGQPLTQDLHEFNVVGDGSSALLSSYITIERPFTYHECPGKPTRNWTTTGLFSEVATDGTNKTIFQWAAIDHVVPPDASYTCPGVNQAGDGTSANNGFDFFHINSIDKNSDGDYLVSGRHVWTLYKIAGLNSPSKMSPGSIIWRLGGKHSSFPTMDSKVSGAPNLNFSWQHHARFDPSINGVTVWDNSNNGVTTPSAQASSAMSISIESDSIATLIGQYISPSRELDASQGAHQILPNGNHFCNMGSVARVYEYTNDGQLAFNAYFGYSPTQSYRGFRFPWTGTPPNSELALYSYAQGCNDTMAFYSSWNGATEIAQWQYHTSSTKDGVFTQVASAAKDFHFETSTTAPFNLYSYAVALDSNGHILGQTPTVETFVPSTAFAARCSTLRCPSGTNYKNMPTANCAAPATASAPEHTITSAKASVPAKRMPHSEFGRTRRRMEKRS